MLLFRLSVDKICVVLVKTWFLFLLAYPFSAAQAHQKQPQKRPCGEQVLLSAKPDFYKRMGITAEERAYWGSHSEAAKLLSGIESTWDLLRTAPTEAMDWISVLRLTDFSNQKGQKILMDYFSHQPIAADFEILFDKEISAMIPELNSLFAASSLGSEEASAWHRNFHAVPARSLILAHLLSTFPKSHVIPSASRPNLVATILRMRPWLKPDATLRPLVTSSRMFTLAYTKASLAMLAPPSRVLVPVGNESEIESFLDSIYAKSDREAMVEWVTEKLHSKTTPDADAPAEWRSLYQHVLGLLTTPLNRQPRVKTSRRSSDMSVTVGEANLLAAFSLIGETVFQEWRMINGKGNDRSSIPVEQLIFTALRIFLHQGEFQPEHLSAFTSMFLKSLMVNFPSGREIHRALEARMVSEVLPALRQYYPVKAGKQSTDLVQGSFEAELATTESPVLSNPAMDQEVIEQEMAVAAQSSQPALLGKDFITASTTVESLEQDQIYFIDFKRAHRTFFGRQQVQFKGKLLERMLDYVTKEVEPESWLRALEMGIAAPHGQRGLKVLGREIHHEPQAGLRFELKLLLSPWRIFGHYRNGVWILESLENHHH